MDVLREVLRLDWTASGLPHASRRRLLGAAEEELAQRVGQRLEAHTGASRMEEFDGLGEPHAAERWLTEESPRFCDRGDYRQLERLQRSEYGTVDRERLLVEYAMMRWLDRWYPGLGDAIEDEVLVLRAELLSQRELLVHLVG